MLNVIRYVRLRPFDQQTEQGRAAERYRLAAVSIIANVLSRVFGIALTLLSVGLTLPYLGAERFGIWMTVASFAAILTFLDLGVGNALTNHVAQRAALSDRPLLRSTISGGLGFLAIIGVCIGALLCLLAVSLPWEKIIKVTDQALLPEVRIAAIGFALLFGANIFSSGVARVYVGMQQGFIVHLVTAFTTVFACVAMWYAAETKQGILVLLCIVMGAQIINGLVLLVKLAKDGLFSIRCSVFGVVAESKFLIKAGGLFFLLQIGMMVGWGADSLIIANALGAAQVAVFSVVQRLFQFATQPLNIINAPLWPAYADADARGDGDFIRKTLRKSMLLTFSLATLSAIVLLFIYPWLVKYWTQSAITAGFGFVALYAVWSVLDACGNAFAMFLNGSGVIGLQVRVTTLFVLIALPLKMLLVHDFGISGLIGATVFSYIICVAAVYGYMYRRFLFKF